MKTILVVGLPGVGKTTLLERWKSLSDQPSPVFTVKQFERAYVERDLVFQQDGAYVPNGLNYEATLDHPPLPGAGPDRVIELDRWMNLPDAIAAESATGENPVVVAVLDTPFFLRLTRQFVALTAEQSESTEGRSVHQVMEALLEGVFVADWVVLNKCDLVSAEDGGRAELLVHHFRPGISVILTKFGDVPREKLEATPGRPDAGPTARRLLEEFRRANPWKFDGSTLTDFCYRSRRPFHPQRFQVALQKLIRPGLSLRGYFWLATRMDWAGYASVTYSTATVFGLGHWLASRAESEWPEALRIDSRRQAIWESTFGDRRQELWITGLPSQLAGLKEIFDAALLTNDEMATGAEAWATLPDPWPKWRFSTPDHDHGNCSGHDHHHEEGHACTHDHHHDHDHDAHGSCCEHDHEDKEKTAAAHDHDHHPHEHGEGCGHSH